MTTDLEELNEFDAEGRTAKLIGKFRGIACLARIGAQAAESGRGPDSIDRIISRIAVLGCEALDIINEKGHTHA